MRLFWMVLFATLGVVGAFLNDSIPVPDRRVSAAGTPEPATGPGSEHANHDFPGTLLDDEAWENLWCKGDNLMKAMYANDEVAGKFWNPLLDTAESQWDSFDDIARWNWQLVTDPEYTHMNFLLDDDYSYGFGLGPAFHDLGLPGYSSYDPNNGIEIVYVSHGAMRMLPQDPGYVPIDRQWYNVGPTSYRATGAYYKFGIETSTGAIFGLDRVAPVKAGAKSNPPILKEGLPSLQRFSDIAWLFWAKRAARKNNLKYIINLAIINKEAQKAIRRALTKTKSPYSPWPGTTFSTESDEGKVLLGSPNGRAAGYFLAQHKAALGGNMYISKISVFYGETEPYIPNMVMFVEQPKPVTKKSSKKRSLRQNKAKL